MRTYKDVSISEEDAARLEREIKDLCARIQKLNLPLSVADIEKIFTTFPKDAIIAAVQRLEATGVKPGNIRPH